MSKQTPAIFQPKQFNLETLKSKLSFVKSGSYVFIGLLVLVNITSLTLIYIVVVNGSRSLPLQKLAGYDVGLRDKDGLSQDVDQISARFGTEKFKLKVGDKEYPFTPVELGINIDKEATINGLLDEGKQGNIADKITSLYHFYSSDREAKLVLNLKKAPMTNFLSKVASENFKPTKNPTIVVKETGVDITDTEQGRVVNKFETEDAIVEFLLNHTTDTLNVNTEAVGKNLNPENKALLVYKLQKITAHDITLDYDGRKRVIKRDKIPEYINFVDSMSQDFLNLKVDKKSYSLGTDQNNNDPTSVSLNENQIQDLVQKIKSEVNQDPIDARFSFDGNRASAFTSSQDGKVLDETAAQKLIADVLAKGETSQVSLPVQTIKAKVNNESVNNLGIKDLLGTGISRFTGSGEGRVFNLNLGSQRLNGVLVAPGETFSMYKALGDVEAATGFKEAYVILNGRTQVGVGGGVCQVSTTLFRALLKSGLPITERHQHAYRVGYYEIGALPGIDAAVYFPETDLQFKNDTPGYILIQTIVDLRSSTLTYNIYGTSDGRRVEMTTPTVSNVRPAPPALYQDDPTLPAGTIKQVDFAAAGAYTSFSRTVFNKDGGVVAQDKFNSNFQPWQAVFLRGTKTS